MFSDEEIEFLRTYYPTKGRKYCAEKINKPYYAVANIAQKMGLKILPGVRSKIGKRYNAKGPRIKPFNKYKVDPNIFMKVTSKDTAYILGLLWADGFTTCNNKSQVIRLKCLRDDIMVFSEIFMRTGDWGISLNIKVKGNRRPQGIIGTSNRPLARFLISHNYGAYNEDSADSIISTIPNHLKKYWFRGLIDGDGCWYINKNNRERAFSLVSCYNQDWTYFENLLQQLDIKYKVQKNISISTEGREHKNSKIRIRNKAGLIKLGNYIYSGYEKDKIGLRRKYDKYILIENY